MYAGQTFNSGTECIDNDRQNFKAIDSKAVPGNTAHREQPGFMASRQDNCSTKVADTYIGSIMSLVIHA